MHNKTLTRPHLLLFQALLARDPHPGRTRSKQQRDTDGEADKETERGRYGERGEIEECGGRRRGQKKETEERRKQRKRDNKTAETKRDKKRGERDSKRERERERTEGHRDRERERKKKETS